MDREQTTSTCASSLSLAHRNRELSFEVHILEVVWSGVRAVPFPNGCADGFEQ
jgi:hypothetical protein